MAPSCLVVGAGISGLLAARELSTRNITVTILEKSRGVGGRMATRRTSDGVADHGAQFLSARSRRFADLLREWRTVGLVELWSNGFSGPGPGDGGDGHPRFFGTSGMTTVPKHLASTLNVLLNERVASVEVADKLWKATTVDGLQFWANALVLTPPLPQSLALLRSGETRLSTSLESELAAVTYNPCLALVVSIDGPSSVPSPGGLHLGPEPVRWIADNRQKGISPNATTLTIHAGPAFSKANIDELEQSVTRVLLESVRPLLGSRVLATQLHRWKFSEAITALPSRAILALDRPPLVLAGDAFAGPHVEGAATSGLAAAEMLLPHLLRLA